MKERPVIFNSEMVKAILNGRKTNTRRPIKPQPYKTFESLCWDGANKAQEIGGTDDKGLKKYCPLFCPYGKPGDRLWVKETFFILTVSNYDPPREVYERKPMYKASMDEIEKEIGDIKNSIGNRLIDNIEWKPSIHMKREFSRITLEITDVRVERVQDISEEDAEKEGCYGEECLDCDANMLAHKNNEPCWDQEPYEEFGLLWDKIYDKKGYGWDKNPWVWAITFKTVNTNL